MNHFLRAVALASIVMWSIACRHQNSGPMERAGERGDEIVDNVKKGKPLLHKKGGLEKAGEAIDETLGTNRN